MAVKPITNKQVVSSTLVNRAEQKTMRGRKARGANPKTTFVSDHTLLIFGLIWMNV